MMRPIQIVLVDLDGVIADDRWRIPKKFDSYDAYHEASKDDAPHGSIVNMINGLKQQEYYIVAITAKPEKWRVMTMNWLTKHSVLIDELWMRPDNDYRRSPELKLAMATPLLEDVVMMIDNREDVIELFNSYNITTMLVNPK